MKNILAKLLLVQSELNPIKKDEINPHFKNRYFDINSLLGELKPILTKHGLVILQPIIDNAIVTTIYDVESAEVVSSSLPLPQLDDMQKRGGAISYGRRFALTSMLAIEGETDDDGNTAGGTQPSPVKSTTGGAERTCTICNTSFIPNPQYPYAKTCSAKCGAAAKAQKTITQTLSEEAPF